MLVSGCGEAARPRRHPVVNTGNLFVFPVVSTDVQILEATYNKFKPKGWLITVLKQTKAFENRLSP
ncbi:hypothetical protein Desmer_4121 [Desulfosporosinus meridiei DSM 13257]|uniref:Uncharacterized protein n=1 Tax=Desulfosporosinus meridiei (strain ATCC BAA-275 / DSM 13257 / KCTC 12902 / NCIMB 13706 / S10) TaxID=768704 RepID=J7IW29_DESMD|nr:hypothetical protein Desmer_4121 [Desulfosporosinus meridiei DSM 13257]